MLRAGRRRRAGQGLAGDPFAFLLLLQLAQQLARSLGMTGGADGGHARGRRHHAAAPVATLALAASMLASYFAPELADAGLMPETLAAALAPPLDDVCLQPRLVVEGAGASSSPSALFLRRVLGGSGASSPQHRQWSRLVASAFTHADLSHLVYNLSSLLYKGSILESRLTSFQFAALFAELLLLSHGLFVAAAFALGRLLPSQPWARSFPFTRFLINDVGWPMYAHTCAVGCSAVLFALKVVLQADQRGEAVVAWGGGPFAGLRVPARHASWVELLLASAVNPRASFTGHLCGILAGLLHVKVFVPAWRRRARWGFGVGVGFGGGGAGVGRRLAGGGGGGGGVHVQGRRAPVRQQVEREEEEEQQQRVMTAEELRAARLRRLGAAAR